MTLYFHGNGGALRYRVDRFRALTAQGDGLVALSYRGYAGSTGSPTEPGILNDARAAYDFAVARYPADRLVLWGESLGSGVAVALAAERPVARIVLEAPFLSAADVAAGAYPFVPVYWLMKDQFRSDLRIDKVDRAGADHARRSRQRSADRVRPGALPADQVAQALRAYSRRRARKSRRLRRS